MTVDLYARVDGGDLVPVGGTPDWDRLDALETQVGTRAAKASLPVAATDRGVVADGTTDDTAALRAVLADVGPQGSVTIAGTVRVTGPISVPAGVTVAGLGPATTVLVDPGFDFPVFLVDGVAGAVVRDLTVRKAPGAAAVAGGNAVRVAGDADNCAVTDVFAVGMSSGFYVAGQLGTAPGTARRAVLTRCHAADSVVFGFELDECDGTELAHCSSNGSGLDGVKLRRKTFRTRVLGGFYTGAIGGDGMDCFAGGNLVTIDGTVFSGNGINGLVIKNDDLSRTDPATYGIVGAVNVIGVIATGNTGYGIACHRSSGVPDDPTEPLVSGVNILGGQLSGNGGYGLYLNARRVTVAGLSATRNGLDGVYLEPACRDIDLDGVHADGNSTTAPNTRDGIRVAGSRIRIFGGSSIGSSPVAATGDADLAAGTKTQRYGLRIEPASSAVDVYGLRPSFNATGAVSDPGGVARWVGPAQGAYLTPGRYVTPAGTRATLATVAATEYAVPLYVAEPGALARIACEITAAGSPGTVVRLGVRADLGHMPGPVLAEVTVPGDAVGTPEATIAVQVDAPGVVWLTATVQSTGSTLPTVRSTTGPGLGVSIGSLAAALGATPNGGYIGPATTTGALPGTYTVVNRSGGLPLVAVRG